MLNIAETRFRFSRTDSMDSSATVTPKSDDKDGKDSTTTSTTTSGSAVDASVGEKEIVLESQLNLAVDVLTSKACTEEGLEDCTNLLLHISRINPATRYISVIC